MEKSLLRCAKANLQKFSVLWLSEKANFPNRKETPISLLQNKVEGNSSVVVPWKNEFSECETNHFFLAPKQNWTIFSVLTSWKSVFSEYDRNRFFMQSKYFWRDYQRFGTIRMRIFRMRKKSLFDVAKNSSPNFLRFGNHIIQIFRIRKKWLFRCAIQTLKEFSALWRSE